MHKPCSTCSTKMPKQSRFARSRAAMDGTRLFTAGCLRGRHGTVAIRAAGPAEDYAAVARSRLAQDSADDRCRHPIHGAGGQTAGQAALGRCSQMCNCAGRLGHAGHHFAALCEQLRLRRRHAAGDGIPGRDSWLGRPPRGSAAAFGPCLLAACPAEVGEPRRGFGIAGAGADPG